MPDEMFRILEKTVIGVIPIIILLPINMGLAYLPFLFYCRPACNKRYSLGNRIAWCSVLLAAEFAGILVMNKTSEENLSPLYVGYLVMFLFLVVFMVLIELIIYNIGERKGLARQKEFLTAVTHELKTPMQVICRYGDQVRKECGAMPQAGRTAEKLNAEIRKMDNRLMEICRYNSLDVKEMHKREFALDGLVIDLADEFAPMTEDKGIALDTEGVARKMEVKADEMRMRWAIHSLLSNAVKFTPTGGEIRLTLTRAKKRVKLMVYNSGSHIPEKKLKDIWKAFNKADTEKDNAQRGTGMGLPIVRDVISSHKGRWDAKNTGDGMVFWFEIPVDGSCGHADFFA